MSSDYRYEIKFVLDNARLSDAMQWLYNETTASKAYDNRTVNSIYFDDLSYNHENGDVFLHTDVINKVKEIDLKYYDYHFLKKINE